MYPTFMEYPIHKEINMSTKFLLSVTIAFGLLVAIFFGALAYNSEAKGQTFNATFTKWVIKSTPAPGVMADMVGVVGGDVGPGTFTGEVINMDPGDEITSIEALYHINGSKHAFTADLKVTQNNSTGKGTITGRVTEGWLKGASVIGKYIVMADCPIATPNNADGTVCYQGALLIQIHK
jgi:hypothetical protein